MLSSRCPKLCLVGKMSHKHIFQCPAVQQALFPSCHGRSAMGSGMTQSLRVQSGHRGPNAPYGQLHASRLSYPISKSPDPKKSEMQQVTIFILWPSWRWRLYALLTSFRFDHLKDLTFWVSPWRRHKNWPLQGDWGNLETGNILGTYVTYLTSGKQWWKTKES